MTKFDEDKLRLRRAFSLEEIKEEESWCVSDSDDKDKRDSDSESENNDIPKRRYSFPLTPRTMA